MVVHDGQYLAVSIQPSALLLLIGGFHSHLDFAMAIHSSDRIAKLQFSDIRHMTRECERRGGINLGQGLGDLPAPPDVKNGAIDAILENRNTYALSEGVPALREAIASKLQRYNGLSADPNSEIIVTGGTTGAFAATLTALLNPGDGVLLLAPYYGYHLNTILLQGLEPQFLSLTTPDFALHEQALADAVRPNTRAIVVCTPANPSGKMFSAAELRAVEKVANQHDLLVITDEIYEHITYENHRHISPATIGSLRSRTVSIMGFSKTFSITGWRLGYVVAPEALAHSINLVADLIYVCAPTPLQFGVLAGLRGDPSFIEQHRQAYEAKRNILCAGLKAAGLPPIVPQGAYYVLADIRAFGYPNAKAAAMAMLEQTGVASIPGSAFFPGSDGDHLLRFCFAKDDATLHQAIERLQGFRLYQKTA